MTRAKDISKIVTDANLSGTLDVTGTMTAGGLTIGSPAFPTGVLKVKQDADNTRARGILLEANADDSLLAIGYNNGKFHLSTSYYTGGSFQPISVFTSNLERLNIASNGDISFYEDTGTTPKLFWDASAESLGIGTSSPAYKIDVNEIGHNSTGELLLTGGNASNDDYTQTTLLRLRATSINANVPSHADSSSVAEIRLNHANESGSNSSGYITFLTTGSNYNTNPAERMRIDSSGNVGIGTTTAAGGNGKGVAIYQSDYPRLSFRNSSTGDGSSDGVQMYMVSNDYYQFNNEIGSQIFGTSGTERMKIDANGHVTMPYQSAFHVHKGSTQVNITLNTSTTITFDNENFDNNGDFASSTFTAPVTGKYQLNVSVRVDDVDDVNQYTIINLVTSNRTIQLIHGNSGYDADVNYMSISGSHIVDMDANDTAFVQISLPSSGTNQLDVNAETRFSGFLVC